MESIFSGIKMTTYNIEISYYFIDFPFSSYLNLKHFLILLPFSLAYFDMDKFFPTFFLFFFCCCCFVRKHKLQKQHQHFGFITILRRKRRTKTLSNFYGTQRWEENLSYFLIIPAMSLLFIFTLWFTLFSRPFLHGDILFQWL